MVGSVNVDLVIGVDELPQAGETVLGRDLVRLPGGKGGNQAVALARLGADVVVHAAVGDDGSWSVEQLAAEGVSTAGVVALQGIPTGIAVVTVSASDNSIVVVPGANGADWWTDRQLDTDVVVVSQEVPESVVRPALAAGRAAGARTVLNAAPSRPVGTDLLGLADVLVVNQTELSALARGPVEDAAHRLAQQHGGWCVVTLGAGGCLGSDGGPVVRLSAYSVEAVDPTGAGDCFVAALALAVVRGDSLAEAMRWASAAAALSTLARGARTGLPTAAAVDALVAAQPWGGV